MDCINCKSTVNNTELYFSCTALRTPIIDPPSMMDPSCVALASLQMRLLADLSGSAISAQIAGALVGGGAGDLSTASDTAPHVFQARCMHD
jgi:hypothetical protein